MMFDKTEKAFRFDNISLWELIVLNQIILSKIIIDVFQIKLYFDYFNEFRISV